MSIEDRIRERVLAELDLTENLSDVQILEEIRREICLEGKRCALSYDRRKELERHIFHSLRRLDILQDFLEDEDITEIMVNGPSCIFLERQGRIERSKRQFYSAEKLQDVIQQIASTQNQIISETNPILDTRIPEFGARVNIVMSPIAIGSPVLTIRKFPREPITMERLLEYGSLSVEMEEFLRDAVYAGYNIFISGETSSGKTTFLNALTEFIPSDARVITIEDYFQRKAFISNPAFMMRRDRELIPMEKYGLLFDDPVITMHHIKGKIICTQEASYVYVQYPNSIWNQVTISRGDALMRELCPIIIELRCFPENTNVILQARLSNLVMIFRNYLQEIRDIEISQSTMQYINRLNSTLLTGMINRTGKSRIWVWVLLQYARCMKHGLSNNRIFLEIYKRMLLR